MIKGSVANVVSVVSVVGNRRKIRNAKPNGSTTICMAQLNFP